MENGFILSTNESSGALQSFSIAFWLKTNSNAGGKIIGFESTQFALSQSYDRHIQMGPEGRINFCIWPHKTVVLTSPKPYNDNQWHFVVATNGERGAKLYVDNILVNSTGFQNLAPYKGFWRIGSGRLWTRYTGKCFNGLIDELRVFKKELNQEEMSDIYKK